MLRLFGVIQRTPPNWWTVVAFEPRYRFISGHGKVTLAPAFTMSSPNLHSPKLWSAWGDLNPHSLARTSPSSWRVCEFRHKPITYINLILQNLVGWEGLVIPHIPLRLKPYLKESACPVAPGRDGFEPPMLLLKRTGLRPVAFVHSANDAYLKIGG